MNDSSDIALLHDMIRNLPSVYWATREPWRILIISFTIISLFSIEGIFFFCLLKYKGFREWVKEGISDADHKFNTIDIRNAFMNWGIFISIRVVCIAATWHIVFAEDQIDIIVTLTTFAGLVITGNVVTKKIEDKQHVK